MSGTGKVYDVGSPNLHVSLYFQSCIGEVLFASNMMAFTLPDASFPVLSNDKGQFRDTSSSLQSL